MKEVLLNMDEMQKYKTIKELVDHNGNKLRTARKLSITVRHVNRLIHVLKKEGKEGFIHGNHGRNPKNKINPNLPSLIIQLYTTKYKCEDENIRFNFSHFLEQLKDNEGIVISRPTLSKILEDANIISPLAHRVTRRKHKRKQLEKEKRLIDKNEKEIEEIITHEISLEDAHPRKDREKYFGETIEMDASSFEWFGGIKTYLHLAIDNATGKIVGGWFDTQETLKGYYHVFYQILTNYGIPYRFRTDKRTVFTYESMKKKDENNDVLTQFGYACHILGTILECSSIPQFKAQVERVNGTVQRRLKNELWIMQINNIKEANKYLLEVFIPKFNNQFGIKNKCSESVFEKVPDDININNVLSVICKRKIDTGHAIAYNNRFYIPAIESNKVYFAKKTYCLVIKTFDGKVVLSIEDKQYDIVEVNKVKKVSTDFDLTNIDENLSYKPVKKAPNVNHPWRKKSYERYLKSTLNGVLKTESAAFMPN